MMTKTISYMINNMYLDQEVPRLHTRAINLTEFMKY